ncbi:hypothetical protein L21SP2_1522 [Salinispira pacifica]|uniref:Uncharacterized protein n=1 Tax=Salinispira pacifica TaxID=1307761 RepID=V5WGF4_9SPIO|nr:hypothetical protein L21SP2_1522 [Salinispira pacifica]
MKSRWAGSLLPVSSVAEWHRIVGEISFHKLLCTTINLQKLIENVISNPIPPYLNGTF